MLLISTNMLEMKHGPVSVLSVMDAITLSVFGNFFAFISITRKICIIITSSQTSEGFVYLINTNVYRAVINLSCCTDKYRNHFLCFPAIPPILNWRKLCVFTILNTDTSSGWLEGQSKRDSTSFQGIQIHIYVMPCGNRIRIISKRVDSIYHKSVDRQLICTQFWLCIHFEGDAVNTAI